MKIRSIGEMLQMSEEKKKKEEQAKREKKHRANFFVRNAKLWLILFANTVALAFDFLAVTTVYSLTGGNYLMSGLSLLPTGIPMILWELAWLNPLSNTDQKNRAVSGMVLSVVSAVIVGVLAVLAIELPGAHTILSIVLLIWCVGAVVFHGLQSAFYFYKDPVIEREHLLQTTISDQEFQMDTLAQGRSVMKTIREGLEDEKALRLEFGDDAVNRWLGIVLGEGDGLSVGDKVTIGSRPNGHQPDQLPQPARHPFPPITPPSEEMRKDAKVDPR